MTILSDGEIAAMLATGKLVITPEPELAIQLQPASLDLRLGNRFSFFRDDVVFHGWPAVIDPRETDVSTMMETIESSQFGIHPGAFALGHTMERVKIPDDLVGVVDGRSSLGRLGVGVHVTAGYIDPGFEGQITLELHNVGVYPVVLHAGDRICQLRFHRMDKAAVSPYAGKYQGDTGAVASRIIEDSK